MNFACCNIFKKYQKYALLGLLYYFVVYPLYAYLERGYSFPHLPLTIIFYIIPSFFLFIVLSCTILKNHCIDRKGLILYGLALFVFLYILSVVMLNCVNFSTETTYFNLIFIFNAFVTFIMGIFMKRALDRYMILFLFLFFFASFFWFFFADFSILRVDFSTFKDSSAISLYLQMGEGYVIISLLLLYVSRNKKYLPVIVIMISLMILFFLNSRAALFLYVLVLFFPFVSLSNNFRVILICSILLIFLLIIFYVDVDVLFDTRVFRLILRTEQDTSLLARESIMDHEISYLWKNWFWGDYSNYALRRGLGGYIHNYLSFWAQFGVIPFLCVSVLFLWAGIFNLKMWLSDRKKYMLLNMFFWYALSGCVTAKAFPYLFIWFTLGMTLRTYWDSRYDINKIKM